MVEPCSPIDTWSLKPAMDVAIVSPRPAHPRDTLGNVTKTTSATVRMIPDSPTVVVRIPLPKGRSWTP